MVRTRFLVSMNCELTNRSIAAESDTIGSVLGSTNAYTMPSSQVRTKQDPITGEEDMLRDCLTAWLLTTSWLIETWHHLFLLDTDDDHPNETKQERKRRLGRKRSARWRATRSENKLSEIRARNALKKRLERQRETPDEAAARRVKDALNKKNKIRSETPEQAEARRRKTAQYMKKARQGETPEQTAARRLRDASNKRKPKQEDDSDDDYIKIELDPLEDLDEQIFRYAEIMSEPSSTSLLRGCS